MIIKPIKDIIIRDLGNRGTINTISRGSIIIIIMMTQEEAQF